MESVYKIRIYAHAQTRTRKKRIIANRTRFLISIARPIYHLELSNISRSVTPLCSNTRDSTRLDVTLKILGNRAYIPPLIRLIKQDPLSTSLGSIYVSASPTHHRHESADNRSTTISPLGEASNHCAYTHTHTHTHLDTLRRGKFHFTASKGQRAAFFHPFIAARHAPRS